MKIISLPISDPLLDKNFVDSLRRCIKRYLEKNPIPPRPDGGSIYLEEFAINGGEIEDKICESIKRKNYENQRIK